MKIMLIFVENGHESVYNIICNEICSIIYIYIDIYIYFFK